MKKISVLIAVFIAAVLIISIPRTVNAKLIQPQTINPVTNDVPPPFLIELVRNEQLVDGNWEWVWSIEKNPESDAQDLSHWGIVVGNCFSITDVVTAAYSHNGTSWNSFSPSISADKSQNCINAPVLKFDIGIIGSSKTYYKLVLNKYYPEGSGTAYYKSGSRSGCGLLSDFKGIGIDCNDFWTDN